MGLHLNSELTNLSSLVIQLVQWDPLFPLPASKTTRRLPYLPRIYLGLEICIPIPPVLMLGWQALYLFNHLPKPDFGDGVTD